MCVIIYILYNAILLLWKSYSIAGKFGGGKFDEFTLFEHLAKNVWQFKRSAKRLLLIWMSLAWRITDDSPNSPNFPAIWYVDV